MWPQTAMVSVRSAVPMGLQCASRENTSQYLTWIAKRWPQNSRPMRYRRQKLFVELCMIILKIFRTDEYRFYINLFAIATRWHHVEVWLPLQTTNNGWCYATGYGKRNFIREVVRCRFHRGESRKIRTIWDLIKHCFPQTMERGIWQNER